MAARIPVKS